MKPTYTIRRIPIARGFRFELYNTQTLGILKTEWSTCLVSPRWMRLRAARLNIIARQIGITS